MMAGGNIPQRRPRNADCRVGVFATRRFPRPLPFSPPCSYHAVRMLPPMETNGFYHDAAREGRALAGGRQLSARPYSTSPTKNAIANLAN